MLVKKRYAALRCEPAIDDVCGVRYRLWESHLERRKQWTGQQVKSQTSSSSTLLLLCWCWEIWFNQVRISDRGHKCGMQECSVEQCSHQTSSAQVCWREIIHLDHEPHKLQTLCTWSCFSNILLWALITAISSTQSAFKTRCMIKVCCLK